MERGINFGSDLMPEHAPMVKHIDIARYLDFADIALRLSGQKLNQTMSQQIKEDELDEADKAKLTTLTTMAHGVQQDQQDVMSSELPNVQKLREMNLAARLLLENAAAFIVSIDQEFSLTEYLKRWGPRNHYGGRS